MRRSWPPSMASPAPFLNRIATPTPLPSSPAQTLAPLDPVPFLPPSRYLLNSKKSNCSIALSLPLPSRIQIRFSPPPPPPPPSSPMAVALPHPIRSERPAADLPDPSGPRPSSRGRHESRPATSTARRIRHEDDEQGAGFLTLLLLQRRPSPPCARLLPGREPSSRPSLQHLLHSLSRAGTGRGLLLLLGARQPMYRILCKAGEERFSLAARDGKVCLVRTDRDDDTQHWIKDMKYSTRVKDEEGYPAMALVNKASGEALKHSLGQSHHLHLWVQEPVPELHQAPARNG